MKYIIPLFLLISTLFLITISGVSAVGTYPEQFSEAKNLPSQFEHNLYPVLIKYCSVINEYCSPLSNSTEILFSDEDIIFVIIPYSLNDFLSGIGANINNPIINKNGINHNNTLYKVFISSPPYEFQYVVDNCNQVVFDKEIQSLSDNKDISFLVVSYDSYGRVVYKCFYRRIQ